MEPAWKFVDLVEACRLAHSVFVRPEAMATARSDFKLYSQREVLAFIATGFDDHRFVHSGPWRNNPNPTTPIIQDEYAFWSGPRHGYLAFMYIELTGKWQIKSFKFNRDPDPRNLIFAKLLAGRKV